jgi:polysaccharide pyruvyl transferase WcaK-like protein
MKKILLTGYYGFQNLGDDLLFICNYQLLEKLYPGSAIDILTESPDPFYLNRLVGKQLRYLKSNSSGDYDIIWHGGGGVFFDFKEGDRKSLWLNHLIGWIGPGHFTKAFQWFKKKAGKPVITFRQRIGMGIGVGTFTRSSVKFRSKIQQLCTFDHLIVRDEESKKNALNICPSLHITSASDIVFDTDLWMPPLQQNTTVEQKANRNIGIVLRDWSMPSGYNYLEDIFALTEQLKKDGCLVNFFAFDANTDKQYIKFFESKGETVNVWQPYSMSLSEYLQQLNLQDLIITSRFHGAIVGSCLGIPGICLNIEPKLKSAIEMLPGIYTLINMPLNKAALTKAISMVGVDNNKIMCGKALAQNRRRLLQSYRSF